MPEFNEQEKQLLLHALNALLKGEQNALQAATEIVPLATKVQSIPVAKAKAE